MKDQLQRRRAKAGDASEAVACWHLRARGFLCVEPIERAWTVKRVGSKIVGAFPKHKVSGDAKAVCPGGGGRAVHIEIKSRSGRLGWSDLEQHQVAHLIASHAAGALSLLIWVHPGQGVAVMPWPIPGLDGPRTGIGWDQAIALDLKRAPLCQTVIHYQ
jgi:hypothetical protein